MGPAPRAGWLRAPLPMASAAEEPEQQEDEGGELVCESIPCLFAPSRVYGSAEEAYDAIRREHGLDLRALNRELGFYSCVKLINFLRSLADRLVGGFSDVTDDGELQVFTAGGEEVVATLGRGKAAKWQQERWLTPVLADDGLLTGLDDELEAGSDAVEGEGVDAKLDMSPALFAELSALQDAGSQAPEDASAAMDLASLVFFDLEGGEQHMPEPQPEPELESQPQPQRVGIVLDHHHLEVSAKQRALATSWDPAVLVTTIRDQLSAALAAETRADPPPLEVVQCHAADSLLVSQQEKLSAKGRLHTRLEEAGFQMHCSPNKTSKPRADGTRTAGGQGATDVDVVVVLFDLAGAFAASTDSESTPTPPIDHIVSTHRASCTNDQTSPPPSPAAVPVFLTAGCSHCRSSWAPILTTDRLSSIYFGAAHPPSESGSLPTPVQIGLAVQEGAAVTARCSRDTASGSSASHVLASCRCRMYSKR